MTKGVTFGNVHSYKDLKLILTSKEIGSPAVKTNKVDIPGADSALDLTDYFGEPKYEDVTHKFEFTTIEPQSDFLTQYSTIKNAIHGKKVRIILDDDPAFFYWGRCYVSAFTNEKGIGTISVDCECEPYKYKLKATVVTQTVSGTKVITLTNSRKRAVPTITTTASMTIAFGNGSWANGAGTFTLPELELAEGNNTVTVTGTGTITFRWQEGAL
jgi:phage-related protein